MMDCLLIIVVERFVFLDEASAANLSGQIQMTSVCHVASKENIRTRVWKPYGESGPVKLLQVTQYNLLSVIFCTVVRCSTS